MGKPRNEYIYYPDCAEVPEAAAVNVRNRSYSIAAEVNIETPEAEGVLFAHGCLFGGHSLYIKDGLLKYVYNFCSLIEQKIELVRESAHRQVRTFSRLRPRRDGHAHARHADPLYQR